MAKPGQEPEPPDGVAILAEEAAWPSPDEYLLSGVATDILAEEAAWPSPDGITMCSANEIILAEEAAWPSPDMMRAFRKVELS